MSRSNGKNSKPVFIGLGSNLGDKKGNLEAAINHLEKSDSITIAAISPFYDTEPQGYEDQPDFLNCVVKVQTSLEPEELLELLKQIERNMGREKVQRWGPRIIDLDILFYDTLIVRNNGLRIPHPEVHKRWFVLKPMNDIDPDYKHPVLKKTIRQLLEELYG